MLQASNKQSCLDRARFKAMTDVSWVLQSLEPTWMVAITFHELIFTSVRATSTEDTASAGLIGQLRKDGGFLNERQWSYC